FFFQAEDGIRDFHVTGVQTCALPISTTGHTHSSGNTAPAAPSVGSRSSGTTNSVNHIPPYREVHFVRLDGTISGGPLPVPELRRSEERRVGKEWSCRWSP